MTVRSRGASEPTQPSRNTGAPLQITARPNVAALEAAPPVEQADAFVDLVIPQAARAESIFAAHEGNPDTDPMTHVNYLASPELKGRGSPSEGYNLASAYAADLAKKYGAKGANPSDPSGNPYYQTLNVFTFTDQEIHEPEGEGPATLEDRAVEPFEKGFYLDETLTPEDLDRIEAGFAKAGRPLPLNNEDGTRIGSIAEHAVEAGQVQNVVSLFEGTGPQKNEVVVIMAHLDHVGVQGGKVHPGADDNASGSSAVLSLFAGIADAKAKGLLNRSVLVLLTAAEEKGLVGSQYFASHPIPGLTQAERDGVINMDMVGRFEDQRLSVIHKTGGKNNSWQPILESANNQLEDPFDVLNRDIDSLVDRQDGAVFTRKGEDVLMVFEGLTNPNGGGNLHADYHKPTDTPDKIIRDNGGNKPRRVRDLAMNLLMLRCNRPEATESVSWN